MIGLSTDKAASPVNLYGATKLCMEKLLVAANSYSGANGPQFKLVRYGNVVGSAGSVLPMFLQQRETGTLTLTDPSMTRFWIRMDQAIDLVMLTLSHGPRRRGVRAEDPCVHGSDAGPMRWLPRRRRKSSGFGRARRSTS